MLLTMISLLLLEEMQIILLPLGLSTYTEILGGLYCGDLSGKKKDLNRHYKSFIREFFHPDYMEVDRDLRKDHLEGIYSVVRSGLTHEYFIKKVSKIEMDCSQSINCGITYDPGKSLLNNIFKTLRMYLKNTTTD